MKISEIVQEGFGRYHYKATPDGNFSYKGKTYGSEQLARRAERSDKLSRMSQGKDYKDQDGSPLKDPWGKQVRKTRKTG